MIHSDQRLVWWSWADIVKHAHQLGIPNFQRGAVWGVANRTALLESMFEQSPCGSFVLWQPADDGDPCRHGVPVLARSFGQDVMPMWLVDGQQRTRAMLDTYRQIFAVPASGGWTLVRHEDTASLRTLAPAELIDTLNQVAPDDDDSEDDRESRYWAVVLPAMRQFDVDGGSYFADRSESRGVRRGAIFRRITATARKQRDAQGKAKRLPPGIPGVLPLALLVSPTGVFSSREGRRHAARLLEAFGNGQPDLAALDSLLPWGPQFITGHAYEMIEDGSRLPIRWADVHRWAGDPDVEFMISRLVGLLLDDHWRPVFTQFRDMFTGGRFAVGWLPKSDVSAAIDAYVRINRAGIRVRQEEQALALLSRAHPHLLDELAEFIRARDGGVSLEAGRSLLVYESDRHMGFAVWMRAVTRYSALALLGTTACGWLGTTAIEKDTFRYRLGRVGPDETEAGTKTWALKYSNPRELVRECSARVTRALTLVDSVMSQELRFDHRMARPSTWALTPLVDLLYRVPEPAFDQLEQDLDFRAAIARLLHWTLLAPYLDQADLRRLINDIHGVPNTNVQKPLPTWNLDHDEWRNELPSALGRYQATFLFLWRTKDATYSERRGEQPASLTGDLSHDFKELGVRAFRADVYESRSLQHPAVGWLYAIERVGGAREFRWEAQYEGYQQSSGRAGIPTSASPYRNEALLKRSDRGESQLYPEKQHIVPFDYARRIVNKGGTRATASPANAIGNLTWLSQRQNGLDGFSNRWAVLDTANDYENLAARGMLWQSLSNEQSPSAIELYEQIRDAVIDGRAVEVKEVYDEFCRIRSDWMVHKMREWLEKPLPDGAAWWLCGTEESA